MQSSPKTLVSVEDFESLVMKWIQPYADGFDIPQTI